MQGPLGEFEIVVLMAVMRLAEEANGSAVRQHIEERAQRKVSRGSVYVTLDRLEEKGLLSSRLTDAPRVRGGTKRTFRITPAGLKAAKHALGMFARMNEGLEPILGRLS